MSYDATAEPNEFVAESREEAIAKATRFYGIDQDDLKIREPEEVFGLGARVVVVAVPKSVPQRPRGGGGEREREHGRDRERGGRGGRERGGRDRGGRDRDRDSRGGRERGPRGERSESRGRRDEPAARVEAVNEALAPVASKGQAEGELSPIGEYVLGIVERMGLGDFSLSESEEDDFVVVQLEGPAIDQLSSDDRAIGAVQLLANQAAMQGEEDAKRVVLDCDGDSEQRDSFLERQAGRAASRAKETGRSVALDPMNGRDRRALHMAVRAVDGVVTMSVGTGRYRQVVIVPEGAAEYEEAATAAREAEERDAERREDS